MMASRNRPRYGILFTMVVAGAGLWAGWAWHAYRPAHQIAGPRTVYWAWERSEDLRFLNPGKEAVAFLASSVELLPNTLAIHPRIEPLLVAPGTELVAVVRIYSHSQTPAALDEAQLARMVPVLEGAAQQKDVLAIQIDFDARASEREFYSRLLGALRQQLGPAYPISITALASWCISDRWISNLPVDEAVPMLFSMGRDDALIRQYLSSVDTFPEPLCRGSVGLSTDEPWPNSVRSRTRVYVFDHLAWTPETVQQIRSKLNR